MAEMADNVRAQVHVLVVHAGGEGVVGDPGGTLEALTRGIAPVPGATRPRRRTDASPEMVARVRAVREEVRLAIGRDGLRQTAREVGVGTASGLRKFVRSDSLPYRKLWEGLLAWSRKVRPDAVHGPDEEELELAIRVLLKELEDDPRGWTAAADCIRANVRRAYESERERRRTAADSV